jgi:lipopolysaccharide/colanic/teichoic acid biosynthesis glycosyltransferase
MIVDADRDGARQAVAGDQRITRTGRILRATAMDEVPQLWNILRGDMSVVGPRALRPGEIEAGSAGRVEPLEDVPGFRTRSAVRPGLTGLAQIHARRDLPRRQKFRYDRLYISRQSLGLDAWLVLQSLVITVLGSWERRGIR